MRVDVKKESYSFSLPEFFNERCREELKEYGFRCKSGVFYRATEDMFQSFHLHRSVSGTDCTVEFTVLPLCEGETVIKTRCGFYHIKEFEDDNSWFEHDKTAASEIECAEKMISYLKKYLMPFFEKSDSAEKAYKAVCEFQKEHSGYKGVFMADYSLYCMALKAKLYDKCMEHLIARKNHVLSAYSRNSECSELSLEYKEKVQKEISEIDFAIEKLEKKDFEYFSHTVEQNETVARANLGIKRTV